jgi:GTP-binding protein Era
MTKLMVVGLLGEPNVGKSSLLNRFIGEKISIVTHKVQTTRHNIRGIVNLDDTQLVFVDTPGLFAPSRRLEKAIVSNAIAALDEVDCICVVLDVNHIDFSKLEVIKQYLAEHKKTCYALLNKIDLISKDELLPIIEKVAEENIFAEIFPVSALKGHGAERFLNALKNNANAGPWMYLEDELTDQPMRIIAEEATREQAYLMLHKELPYSLKIETEKWEEQKNGSVKIYQAIYVLKESQKIIVLGKSGEKIKHIGQKSRAQIEKLTGNKVHLFLHVKVREDWIDKDFSQF